MSIGSDIQANEWIIFTLLALLVLGLWGFFPKLAVKYLDPKSALAFQAIGALACGLLIFFILGFDIKFNANGAIFAALTGITGVLSVIFIYFALHQGGKLSVVVTVSALYPLITLVLAYLFLKEDISTKQLFGIALALVSLFLLTYNE